MLFMDETADSGSVTSVDGVTVIGYGEAGGTEAAGEEPSEYE